MPLDRVSVYEQVMGRLIPDAPDEDFAWKVNLSRAGSGGGAGRIGWSGGRGGFGDGISAFFPHSPAAYGGAMAGRPEAFVKLIARGGCHSAAEAMAQIAYVGRHDKDAPDVEIYGAAAFGADSPQGKADIAETLEAWESGWRGAPKHGHTMHFVVSFPKDADPAKVLRIGKEFADTAFGSGHYGDAWDYFAALHTDKAHPHVHLIVNRRGMDHGLQLQTYKASPLNLDHLRGLQVEIAARHGIAMTATSRLARGVADLAPTARAFREAFAKGERALQRSRSGRAARYAEVAIKAHARAYRDLGRIYARCGDTGRARMLQQAVRLVGTGERIMADPAFGEKQFADTGDIQAFIEERGQLLASIAKVEGSLRLATDEIVRADAERRLGPLKGAAASLAPERADFAPYADKAIDRDFYRSDALTGALMAAQEGREGVSEGLDALKADISRKCADEGVNADAFWGRYAAGGPLEAGTAAAWAARDIEDALRHRGETRGGVTDEAARDAGRALDGLHEYARERFDAFARDRGIEPRARDDNDAARAIVLAFDELRAERARPDATDDDILAAGDRFVTAIESRLDAGQKARLPTEGVKVLVEIGVGPGAAVMVNAERERVPRQKQQYREALEREERAKERRRDDRDYSR